MAHPPSTTKNCNPFYVSYKNQTALLVCWLIQTSNGIIRSLNRSKSECPLKVNPTTEIPVSGVVPVAKLIATHRVDTPSKILALCHSIIKLRTAYYCQFQELAAIRPNYELLSSNSRHKYFIDILTEAFQILGGKAWLAEQEKKKEEGGEEKMDSDVPAVANRFSVLDLDNDSESDTSQTSQNNGQADVNASTSASRRQRRKKQSGKGKGKKGKGKKHQGASEQTSGDVPLEDYHITEDDELQDYFMAVFSMAKDWIELRSLLQDFWRKVAYHNLNGAMVATLGHIAVAMLKQSEALIFGDFPGYESLEKMILTFTGGDPKQAATDGQFVNKLDHVKGFWEREKMPEDFQEAFLINVYNDFVDFIDDFQKTQSGKPTKRMLAQLKGWDPYLDLRSATKEQRLKWRRSYTINWLYDLVNSIAGRALHGVSDRGESYVLEDTDWGTAGPFGLHKRLLGLFEFAVEVTKLAMLKPGTAFRHKITPHLVFQLQCIMDSWTVSRGWAVSGIRGHVLSEPAPDFVPRRHLDMFLGQGEWATKSFGFFKGVTDLKSIWETFRHCGMECDDVSMCIRLYEEVTEDFKQALGTSQLTQMPAVFPSRFSTTNVNGLWDYSPFLCGAGLAEALELSFLCAMAVWDKLGELMLVSYLHGVTSGRKLIKPVRMYNRMDDMFYESFFSHGGKPIYDFRAGFPPQTRTRWTRELGRQMRPGRRAPAAGSTTRDLLDMYVRQNYKLESDLVLYRRAGFDPERIPDSDVDYLSALGLIRLSQTSRLFEPATARWMIDGASVLRNNWPKTATVVNDVDNDDPLMESVRKRVTSMKKDIKQLAVMPSSITRPLFWIFEPAKALEEDPPMTYELMLSVIWNDLYSDICCEIKPYSSLNYLWITVNVLKFYQDFAQEAKDNGSEAVKALFEETVEDVVAGRDKRILASMHALRCSDDEEVWKTLAAAFEKNDPGMDHFMYFDQEREGKDSGPILGAEASPCCVM